MKNKKLNIKQKITAALKNKKFWAHKKSEKISSDMTFADVISKYPKTAEVFIKHGMHCIGCAMAMSETIEQGAMAHGMDIKKLLEDLNKKAKK